MRTGCTKPKCAGRTGDEILLHAIPCFADPKLRLHPRYLRPQTLQLLELSTLERALLPPVRVELVLVRGSVQPEKIHDDLGPLQLQRLR